LVFDYKLAIYGIDELGPREVLKGYYLTQAILLDMTTG
jgi:hypothetical protein